MAVNGFTDICTTVTVPKPEYERLVRESERLQCLFKYLSSIKFPNVDVIYEILGLEIEGVEE